MSTHRTERCPGTVHGQTCNSTLYEEGWVKNAHGRLLWNHPIWVCARCLRETPRTPRDRLPKERATGQGEVGHNDPT